MSDSLRIKLKTSKNEIVTIAFMQLRDEKVSNSKLEISFSAAGYAQKSEKPTRFADVYYRDY